MVVNRLILLCFNLFNRVNCFDFELVIDYPYYCEATDRKALEDYTKIRSIKSMILFTIVFFFIKN
jgi:hypothetical protein